MTETLLTALLLMYHPPADVRARLDARRDAIVADATAAAERYDVPVGLLLAVGFAESHLGTDDASGGSWGSPIDARHRHVAGRADATARDLAASYRACHHDWGAALRRYRTGICAREPARGYSAAFAARLAARLYDRAGLPPPPGLTPTPRYLARSP